MHDAGAVAWEIDPTLITAAPMHIDVELAGTYTRGMTVCDYRHLCGTQPVVDVERAAQMEPQGAAPNAEAALDLDYDRFIDLVCATLAGYR